MAKYAVLDTETTDLNENGDAEVVGFSVAYLNEITDEDFDQVDENYKPHKEISFMAMATHHITPNMVKDKPYFADTREFQELKREILGGCIVVAHNAKFDLGILRNLGLTIGREQVICTMRLAKHLLPQDKTESYSLQYLRYKLGINDRLEQEFGDTRVFGHHAGFDVLLTVDLLKHLGGLLMTKYIGTETKKSLEQMLIDLTQEPVNIERMPFGKYKGLTLHDIHKIHKDHKYLKRVADNAEDEDLRWSVRQELGNMF